MGCLYAFQCEACTYGATLSGGADRGQIHKTTTIACETCRDLFDVVVEKVDLFQDAFPWVPVAVRCPNEKPPVAHQIEPWEHPGPCPRCGGLLHKGNSVLYFD